MTQEMAQRKAEGQRLSDSMYEAGMPGTEIKNALVKEGFSGTTAVALLLASRRKAKAGILARKPQGHSDSADVDSRLLMFNDLRFEQPLKATPRPKAIDKSRNSNQDGRGSVVHIDLQLSGKCSVPTLYRKVLGLIEKLDGGSLRVAGIRVELSQSQESTRKECEDSQEYDSFYDKY